MRLGDELRKKTWEWVNQHYIIDDTLVVEEAIYEALAESAEPYSGLDMGAVTDEFLKILSQYGYAVIKK